MLFTFVSKPNWPPGCWLAKCQVGDAAVEVLHGERVEVASDRFSEAIWAGSFESGDFDMTDAVFGSGGRIRNDQCIFVSPGSTVDRLQYWESEGTVRVSNSLVCLLSYIGAELEVSYKGYFDEIGSISRGRDKYTRKLSTSVGPVELVFFDNLLWNREGISRLAKPENERDFSSFSKYHHFLSQTIEALFSNMNSQTRQFSYRPLATISTGYDSPTVAALCKPFGLKNVLSFDETRHGVSDNGEAIATALGLATHVFSRDSWTQYPDAEAISIAADAKGSDVIYAGAAGLLAGCGLFSGFHGDSAWDAHPPAFGSQMFRLARSGLGLTEFRLQLGFQHLPVPFLGVRQLNDIVRISKSPEMAPWTLENDYDRPICRRILEEAGVPRELFGMEKKFVSADFSADVRNMSATALEDYSEWLRSHRSNSSWFSVSLFTRAKLSLWVRPLRHFVARAIGYIGRRMPIASARNLASSWHATLSRDLDKDPFFFFAFPWAVARSSKRFVNDG